VVGGGSRRKGSGCEGEGEGEDAGVREAVTMAEDRGRWQWRLRGCRLEGGCDNTGEGAGDCRGDGSSRSARGRRGDS
jgi:hypothetical protein